MGRLRSTIKYGRTLRVAAVMPLLAGAVTPANAAALSRPPQPRGVSGKPVKMIDPLLPSSTPPAPPEPLPTSFATVTPPTALPIQTLEAHVASAPTSHAPAVHHVFVPPGTEVVLGHASTLGEALAFAARATFTGGLSGVRIEQDGHVDYEIILGPLSGFAAAQAIKAADKTNFRHVSVESETKSSDAIILGDLPTAYNGARVVSSVETF